MASIPGRDAPPDGVGRQEGAFSVVVDSEEARVRKLPSLYVNDVQLYADRDPEAVVRALERAVDAFVHSAERATYMLTACEIGGRTGLYGSDFFNRSAYRLKLARLGARFSREAFVVFRDDGRFESSDFGPFDAAFLSLGVPTGGPRRVDRLRGAALLHQLAFYRIADICASELARLARVAESVDAVGATEPADLVAALRG